MQLDRYATAGEFLEAASGWLVEREAEHNLILGIGGTARDHPELYGPPYLATVSADDGKNGDFGPAPSCSMVSGTLVGLTIREYFGGNAFT